MGKYGPGASKDDIDVLKMAVANLGTDAAAVFPQGMEIEMKDISMQASTDLYERLAQYLDNQVTKGILGQTATTQGTPGKLGNESAQDEVRKDIRDDDAGQLEATLQRDLVNPFIDLNYGPQQSYPVLRLYAPRKKNVAAITDALSRLVPLGLRVEVSAVRDMLGLPDPPQGAEVLGQRPGPAPMPAAPDEESAQAINEMLSDWQLSDEADFTRRENATDIDVLPPKELKLEPKNTH
jgi:phage gp29-like protein